MNPDILYMTAYHRILFNGLDVTHECTDLEIIDDGLVHITVTFRGVRQMVARLP